MTGSGNDDRKILHGTKSDERRAEMRAGDRARLREIRIQSRSGRPMRHPDHLHAALAFGRLYREATNRRRGTRTRFEDGLREELRLEGLERELAVDIAESVSGPRPTAAP